MDYLFYLNGEYESVARAEIMAIFNAYSIPYTIKDEARQMLLLESEAVPCKLFSRLAMTHKVLELLGQIRPETGTLDPLRICSLMDETSFCVRVKKIDKGINSLSEEQRLSRQITEHVAAPTDLTNPSQLVFGLHVNGSIYVGKQIIANDTKSFAKRKPQYRPYFHPSSLDPRMARALVNLSQSTREVLDPFCGTGGILIEAGLMGIDVFGIDIEKKMVYGSKRNLEFYGINGDIRQGDATQIDATFPCTFETVVTDVPYGKSTVVDGSRDVLYEQSFLSIYDRCKDRAVIVLPIHYDFSRFGFVVEHELIVRVHKSLERHIFVLRKVK